VNFQERHCVLCGPAAAAREKYPANFSIDDLNAAVFSARRLPDRRHFRLVECLGCGMIYSSPACDPAVLARLYETSAVTYERQEGQIYDSYAPVLDRALPGLARRGTFLEIGGGRGFMLRYGHERGFPHLVEVEPSADAERRFVPPAPGARFLRGVFTRDTLPAGSASLACFFQMLDHVPSPCAFLRDVCTCLEPGGAAVCVTHNTRAFSARVLGERSPIFDVEHTYLFHPDNLGRLFQKAGFVGVETFAVANNYSLGYWMHLAPLPGVLKRAGTALLGRSGLANRRVKLYAGNFAVIARKPLSPPASAEDYLGHGNRNAA